MEFKKFKTEMQKHFKKITKDVNTLFEVEVDKDELWSLYLNSFPEGTNEIFRNRSEHDCSCCRQFIKNFGNVIAIENGTITNIWEFETNSEIYQPVVNTLSQYIKSKNVSNIYVSKIKKIGTNFNFESNTKAPIKWEHFYIELEDKFVDKTSKSDGETKGENKDLRNVFKRSLDEITIESVEVVIELISQNSLYRGEEWLNNLKEFLNYKKKYQKLTEIEKDIFTWENFKKSGVAVTKIKNHSIGTLLINISEQMDLETAIKKYEDIVAPQNYKRPKPIYTQKMLDEARKTIEELGFSNSLYRRYATLDDITINNILFSNKDASKRINKNDIFDNMEKEITINPKKFNKVEEITIEKFIKDVIPTTKEIEVMLENKHTKNMVSLIAPKISDSKNMFKWNNNFSWAYTGNITDSSMKENVKSAGGKVDGVLRFSIQWNENDYNNDDFDAHCIEPNGNHIYFSNRENQYTTGELDIDIINPEKNSVAVENITWSNKNKMIEGKYKFYVNNYTHRGGKDGFTAEIEYNGQIFSFIYNKPLKDGEDVYVAEVTLKDGIFTIKELLPSSVSSKEVWGLNTNKFIPVSTVMLSPNYWNEQQGIGNKHYFFMLKDCVNLESPNGFYNEFLKEELSKHKKVFEALGNKISLEETKDQLSGVGFSSTQSNELIVKVKGTSERILKIKI